MLTNCVNIKVSDDECIKASIRNTMCRYIDTALQLVRFQFAVLRLVYIYGRELTILYCLEFCFKYFNTTNNIKNKPNAYYL
jgi:hypothetical protein